MSSTSSVMATANTPSLNASIRPVSLSMVLGLSAGYSPPLPLAASREPKM